MSAEPRHNGPPPAPVVPAGLDLAAIVERHSPEVRR